MSVESGPPPETIVARAAKILTPYYPSSNQANGARSGLAKVLRSTAARRYTHAQKLDLRSTISEVDCQ